MCLSRNNKIGHDEIPYVENEDSMQDVQQILQEFCNEDGDIVKKVRKPNAPY